MGGVEEGGWRWRERSVCVRVGEAGGGEGVRDLNTCEYKLPFLTNPDLG